MTAPTAVAEMTALADSTLGEAAARLAERAGLPLAEARAMLEADPRVRELRSRWLLRAATVDAVPAPGVH